MGYGARSHVDGRATRRKGRGDVDTQESHRGADAGEWDDACLAHGGWEGVGYAVCEETVGLGPGRL